MITFREDEKIGTQEDEETYQGPFTLCQWQACHRGWR